LDLVNAWRGSICDDLHLTALAQRAGFRIAAPRELLLRLFVSTRGFGEVAADALRWLLCFRIYTPTTYAVVMAGLTFAAAGWIVAVLGALALNPTVISVLIAGFALAVLRTIGRAAIVAKLWGGEGTDENHYFLLLDPVLAPVASVLNAAYGWIA